jgi:hypothetical protein
MVFTSPLRQFYRDGTNPAHLSGLSRQYSSIWTGKLASIYRDFAKTHANPDTDGNSPYHRVVRRNILITMKIAATIILIQLLTISCKYSTQNATTDEKALDSQSEKINAEIAYTLINNLVLDSLYQTKLLAIEAMQFYNTKRDTDIIYNFGRYCSYDSSIFQELLKLNIIDSSDIGSISEKISNKARLEWDSTRLRIKTFSFYNLEELLQKNKDLNPYEYTKQAYNTTNFLILSKPIFLDNNTILMGSSYFSDGLDGYGKIYVFSKQNGKWKILYWDFTWIS